MIVTLDTIARQRSTFELHLAFATPSGELVTPKSILWWLRDLDGNPINGRIEVAPEGPLEALTPIVLSEDDLDIFEEESVPARRVLSVFALYDSEHGFDLVLREEFRFHIDPLVGVPEAARAPGHGEVL